MTIEYAGILMGAFVMALITIVIVVLLWRGMEVARTQMASGKDAEYKKLAEAALSVQETLAAEQKATRAALEEIRTRLTAVEKLLRDVG
jgi:5-bromo-4-chloroindolyl phosphate hydrolysis protein